MADSSEISVILVDDHAILRETLHETLEREADFRVVGEAGNGADALQLASELVPDVLVLDITLNDGSGIDTARQIHELLPDIAIVGFSMHLERSIVKGMLAAGAQAYVAKSASKSELFSAIRAVATGAQYLCRQSSRVVAGALFQTGDGTDELTPRERDVLRYLAEGKRSQEIAELLCISVGTVEVHRRNMMKKLEMHSSVELTRYAIREGIISA